MGVEVWFILAVICLRFCGGSVHRTLILVDGFTEYISGYAREYCAENHIEVVDSVSPYLCAALAQQGRVLPQHLRAPLIGQEEEWIIEHELEDTNPKSCFCLAESDSGVSTAERIQKALKLATNGICPHLRNKFLMNKVAVDHGIPVAKQALARSWKEIERFLHDLWSDVPEADRRCVIKPLRGVASDGVYLCHDLVSAEEAFLKLINQPRYEGGTNEAVVVQEFINGQEYAVDTVSMNGQVKVVALWKYSKFAANGAPFVYQCTQLVSNLDTEAETVCEYCIDLLQGLGVQWGPTHTEIKCDPLMGPRLIEVNARFHAQNFVEIVRSCLGYDAVTLTLDAFYHPERFEVVPRIPSSSPMAHGRILHLVSYFEGQITAIHHLDEIRSLPSVKILHLPLEVGDPLVKTIDIRTDCGYIVLIHEDEQVIEHDYQLIVELQKTMFETMQIPSSTSVNDGESVVEAEKKGIAPESQQQHQETCHHTLQQQQQVQQQVQVQVQPQERPATFPHDHRSLAIASAKFARRLIRNTTMLYLLSLIIVQVLPLFKTWILD